MNSSFAKLKRSVIRFINSLFPKNSKKVMFASIPDYSDNARALFEYMINHEEYANWTFVWLASSSYNTKKEDNIVFVKQTSKHLSKEYFYYLYHLFTSKYLFCTHSHFVEANPRVQVSVCLWHGTMLKRICAMNEREKKLPRKDQFRYFVSPSTYYNDLFCKSFQCLPEQVITSGYPRNDFLFQETDILERLGINRHSHEKIIVYMPTFRNPKGGGYKDSTDIVQSCIDLSDSSYIEKLSKQLIAHNILLVVKWHPADSRQDDLVYAPNIMSVSNDVLASSDLQVYHLLHYADALITDYSSVFCDYMMLDRPIAFDIFDIDSYTDNRGFVFDNPVDYMPGYILRTNEDLYSFIVDVSKEEDKSKEKRHHLYNKYNDFKDANSSKRLLAKLIDNNNKVS